MLNIREKNQCCGCYTCFNICPQNAIEMKEDEKGFKYPYVNDEKCTNCGLCERKCPILNKTKNESLKKAYACFNKNEEIRLKSSSGGIFTLIAEMILDNDGVVFGAAFDDDFSVKHIEIQDKTKLYKLRTSKYLQSDIGDTYRRTKKLLEEDKKVLFTGTPCQIDGLLIFLGKEYENLYTQDIICHGVPSPKVWKKYLKYRKEKEKNSPIEINFRNKYNGWKNFSLSLKYENNEYNKRHNEDLFMQAFLRDVSLRDSCYSCFFKNKERKSDITLADFWGIENIFPEINDDKGISLVIVNTEKGKKMFESIQEMTIYKEVCFENSIQYNPSMLKSVQMPKLRDEFFNNLDELEFDELVKKYAKMPKVNIVKRVLRKLKRMLK